jgi:Holliday junction resolvase RusA-like endonuclease
MIGGKPVARAYKTTKVRIGRDGRPTKDSLAWVRANVWYEAVRVAVLPVKPFEPWTGPVAATIDAYFPRPQTRPKKIPKAAWASGLPVRFASKPDRDNLDKAILDACTEAGLWHDDDQVCDGPVRKWYAAAGCEPYVRLVAMRIGWTSEAA